MSYYKHGSQLFSVQADSPTFGKYHEKKHGILGFFEALLVIFYFTKFDLATLTITMSLD